MGMQKGLYRTEKRGGEGKGEEEKRRREEERRKEERRQEQKGGERRKEKGVVCRRDRERRVTEKTLGLKFFLVCHKILLCHI